MKQRITLIAAAALALCGPAGANPVGGTVVSGQAGIAQPSPAQMLVTQTSARAIIDWRSFSIGLGESVRFIQPSAMSATLNRVTGNDPSSVLGTLSANGHVYLVNQNGVYIGRDAQVDVAGLVLSTANISNGNFMAGQLKFDQPGKPGSKIVNDGRITVAQGGLVAMVAPGVENRGVISAKLGQVMLAGARTFSLDLHGDGLMNLVVTPTELAAIRDAGGTPLSHYVDNAGRITAEGGRVWLSASTASGIVDGSVNVSGTIDASSATGRGGDITVLGGDRLDIGGRLLATGVGEGGRIGASATHVALASGALLDASGGTQGGLVQVGGTYRGASPVPGAASMAQKLDVAAGAVAKADATGTVGNGGTVVLWSNDETRFEGAVSAVAGAGGGNGGLLEVSGKKRLIFDGQADAHAPQGAAGTLLLDPGSLTVTEGGTGGFSASGTDSSASVTNINATLRGGSNVVLAADDDIRIEAVIDGRPFANAPGGRAGGSLVLEAGRSVALNQAVVLNGGGFTSTSATGRFTQLASAPIVSFGPDGKSLARADFSITAAGDIQAQYLLTGGSVALSSTAGNVTASRVLGGLAPADQIGSFTALAPGGIVSLAGVGARERVSVDAARIGALGDLYAGSGVALQARAGGIRLGSILTGTGGTVDITAAGPIDLPLGSRITSRSGTVNITATGGGVTADDTIAANDPADAGTSAAPGNITIHATGDVSLAQMVALGATSVTSTTGSIDLKVALGGADRDRPLMGSLRLVAWGDVTTNGLNLAGAATDQSEGLAIDAGTRIDAITGGRTFNGSGRIAINDRIGVSGGALRFGSPDTPLEEGFAATLSQGVYARSGNQDITFNVPVAVNGAKIYSDWNRVLGPTPADTPTVVSNPDAIVDMLMIPVAFREKPPSTVALNGLELDSSGNVVESANALENSFARGLAESGKAYRVALDTTTFKLRSICPLGGCASSLGESATTVDYWMIPKIVISNQENPQAGDSGTITIAAFAAPLAPPTPNEPGPSAALKIIVPSSASEQALTSSNNEFVRASLLQKTQININGDGSCQTLAGCRYFGGLEKLAIGDASDPIREAARADVYAPGETNNKNVRGMVYRNGAIDVLGATSLATRDDSLVALPVSLVFYWGPVSSSFSPLQADGNTVVASTGDFAFRSNSNPGASFGIPALGGANLAQQIAASLVPAQPTSNASASAGNGNGSGPNNDNNARFNVAALQSLDAQSDAPAGGADCDTSTRTVMGRTSGDEADKGATSALHGAPLPVFRTSYALAGVAADLAGSVDARGISGMSGSASCR